jgi:HPt (histidine-containing phosphotransfer) domain-containing protein
VTDEHGDQPVLDEAVLAELRQSTGDDDEFMRELVATYLEEAGAYLDGMTSAAAAGDPAAIVRPAHTLKSSSASIGAMRLSAICRDIEAAGRDGLAEGLEAAAALARSTWNDTHEALRSAGLAP